MKSEDRNCQNHMPDTISSRSSKTQQTWMVSPSMTRTTWTKAESPWDATGAGRRARRVASRNTRPIANLWSFTSLSWACPISVLFWCQAALSHGNLSEIVTIVMFYYDSLHLSLTRSSSKGYKWGLQATPKVVAGVIPGWGERMNPPR